MYGALHSLISTSENHEVDLAKPLFNQHRIYSIRINANMNLLHNRSLYQFKNVTFTKGVL